MYILNSHQICLNATGCCGQHLFQSQRDLNEGTKPIDAYCHQSVHDKNMLSILVVQKRDYFTYTHPHQPPHPNEKSLWSSTHRWKKMLKYVHFSKSLLSTKELGQNSSSWEWVKLLPFPLFWFKWRTFLILFLRGGSWGLHHRTHQRRLIAISSCQLSVSSRTWATENDSGVKISP